MGKLHTVSMTISSKPNIRFWSIAFKEVTINRISAKNDDKDGKKEINPHKVLISSQFLSMKQNYVQFVFIENQKLDRLDGIFFPFPCPVVESSYFSLWTQTTFHFPQSEITINVSASFVLIQTYWIQIPLWTYRFIIVNIKCFWILAKCDLIWVQLNKSI